MLLTLAFVAVCCSEEVIDAPSTSAQTGDDVQFTLSLNKESRTIYGPEANNVFPIYWVEGDKVQIFSPQALAGRRNAEYKVVLPANVTNPNYAEDLTPTGANGVQWGDGYEKTDVEEGMPTEGYHDFYSLYPSGNYSLSEEGTQATGITINEMQNIVVEGTNVKSDMEDCLMYANKKGVSKGSVVNLQYDPISTVLMLTVKVAANEVGTDVDNFTIQSVTLEADAAIAGTFSLNISDGTFGGFEENKSSKTIKADIVNTSTGGYHTISNEESFEIPIFLAPISDLSVKNWKISIVANNNTYTKTLNIEKVLTPGQIHKITLPELKPATTEWDVSKWMTYIPRNVYLSEISIPGTWNSLNVDCQSNTTIADQYDLGVRAFHLDTRWKSDNDPIFGSTFTGITKPEITTLSVATGGDGKTNKYDGANVMNSDASSFNTYLKQITDCVAEDEYMVVFCTFAQNSYNGDLCPSTWYKAISDACAANDKVYNASDLTANTLVGDVLNKVIVVVNLDVNVDSASLPEGSKCLFTYVPMNLPSDHYTKATAADHVDALYNSTKASAGISMYTSHAQISTTGTSAVDCGDRGYSHPLANRDALVNSIWDWSKSNYGTPNYAHDKWIYLGLGGYILTSSSGNGSGYDTVENRYAPMIYNRIEAMGQNNVPYYPMGIILMNNKKGSNYTNDSDTDLGYKFSDVCEEILLLNNKYRLQYDSSKPSDYNPNATLQTSYSATATNGGNAIDAN